MSREQRGILCAALHPGYGCVLFLREVSNTSAAELETQEPATSPREVSQLVFGKRLGTHWKSQHKTHQELSFAIARLHHMQEAIPKAWKCLQLRFSFLLPQKDLCSGERGMGFPLHSFAVAARVLLAPAQSCAFLGTCR